MPILQKRKVQFTKESKTYGMKKIKLSEKSSDSSSTDSESDDETFKNKISSKEDKVSKVTKNLNNHGTKKTKKGKIQQFSSSSESESEGEITKNETSRKKGQIQKYSSTSESESEPETTKSETSPKGQTVLKGPELPKTYGMKKVVLSKTHKDTSSESDSEDEMPKNKTSPKKHSILKNGSPKKYFDSSTSPKKDKILSADEGLKNLKENIDKNIESTCSDSDEQPLVIDEDAENDLLGLQKYMKDELKLNISSPTKAKSNHDAPHSVPDTKNELSCKENDSNSESESEIEGTQEMVKAKNYMQTKRHINKKLNNASSESESDSKKMLKQNPKEDANYKDGVNKNSTSVDSESESDSDIEGTQEIVNKKSYKKVAGSIIKSTNDKSTNDNINSAYSESESDVGETQKPVETKSDNKDVKSKNDANKRSNTTSESESDSGEKQETKNTTNLTGKLIKATTDSESDEEEAQETASKSKLIQGEETNVNVDEESNLNTSETQFDKEETQEALKNECNSPRINYDLEMLSKTNKVHISDNSDFELTLESGASHEEKEPASSDADSRKPKVSSDTVKKTSASRKKKLSLSRKAPSPVAETKRESGDLTPENEATSQNGSLHEDKELASTDTDSKKLSVINGTLKRTKRKTRTSPRKAPPPVAEVKSENELASGNDSSHEDEEQILDARKSKTDAKIKSPSKKKRVNSPEKAPPAAVEPRHESYDLEPKVEEDEVSSDDSADEEDLNEMPLNSTQPTYQPTEEEKRRLASIEILITHQILPQHKVESTAGTRTLKQREKLEFEKYAVLRRGTFDDTEDRQIRKNWKIFCKNHEWDPKNPKPFLFMKIKNKEALMSQVNRKKFMQILAHGLPNRSLYSVFQRFKNLYDPHRTCRYTDDEDRVILDFISNYNPTDAKDRKFAELATILKRTRASVWRRYRVLKRKHSLQDDAGLCHSNR